MSDRTHLTDVESIPENGSYLFTVSEHDGSLQEVILVRCSEGVRAWKNFCQHETDQRLDRSPDVGTIVRGDSIVCPKHGSTFDACSGYCDNGEAKGSTLIGVEVTVEDGDVYLTDRTCEFLYEGPLKDDFDDDDDDDMPSSTSHIGF